jgi:hypothetical protein
VADLLKQFWADAYGKEVQTAATYSYTWLADQFGHLCLGILANVLATLVAGWVMVEWGLADQLRWETGRWPGLILALIGVSLWEWSAYSSSVKQATGTFPLDTKLLRDNAVIAAVYMALGALLGLAFHVRVGPALLITAAVVVAAVLLAPRWLRQKIIWQKASIPYLFRLARCGADNQPSQCRCVVEVYRRRCTAAEPAAGRDRGPDRIRSNLHGIRHRDRICVQKPQSAVSQPRRAARIRRQRYPTDDLS